MLRAIALLLAAGTLARADDFPKHVLKSDALAVTVYLPDAKAGFYRGTRFDWAGVCTVEFAGHKVFGPWKAKHDPKNNDDIVGPVEEFGSSVPPLNYDDAKVGETFVKIGVGELTKPKEDKYRFFHNYAIATAGEWTVEKSDAKITFTQTLTTTSGYGYKYAKILTAIGTELRLTHVLENTGTKAIKTDVYNHNFFNVNGDGVGKNYELEFPFAPTAPTPQNRFAEVVKLDGKKLTFTGELDKGQIFADLGGFDARPDNKDAKVTMRHKPSGVSVTATADKPLHAVRVWGIKETICPEPFLLFDIAPGKKVSWTWKYEFTKAK